MKKILTLALAIMCCTMYALAAEFDLIIKTNSEKIEALIQEVSDAEIRYKKANNPNGPMFVIKLEEVSSIVYSNGEVQAIEHKAKPAPQQTWNNNSGYNYGGYNMYNTNYSNGPMQRIGANEYLIDGHRLRGREFKYFLEQNCQPVARYYKTWQNCEIAGWCLFGVGGVLTLVCGLVAIEEPSSAWGCIPGVALLAGSVPLIACGNVYKKRTADVFNANCGKPQAFQPELHLQSGPNGLGLALRF